MVECSRSSQQVRHIFAALALLCLGHLVQPGPAWSAESGSSCRTLSRPQGDGSAATATAPAIPPELRPHLPAKVDELATLEVPTGSSGAPLAVFYSRRDEGLEPSGRLLLLKAPDQKGRRSRLWRSPLEPTYAPTLLVEAPFAGSNRTVLFAHRHVGAAWVKLDVIDLTGGKARPAFLLEAESIELCPGKRFWQLVAHARGEALDIPRLFTWNGKSFVEVSGMHPTFYGQVLADTRAGLTSPSPHHRLDLARLTGLSGDHAAAVQALQTLLEDPELRALPDAADLRKKIRRELAHWKQH